MLFDMLSEAFPDLKIIPNDMEMLEGYETDIAIPELHLGIEWNGIIHFKPIYGDSTLLKTQRKDAAKQDRAQKLNIRLITISDTTSRKEDVVRAFEATSEIIRELLCSGGE